MPMLKTLRLDFTPEWIAVLAIAAADLIWMRAIGFHLALRWTDGLVVGLALSAAMAFRFFAKPSGTLITEYFALSMVTASLFKVLTYVSLASSGPLIDAQLAAADRAIGFDWLAGYHFVMTHPLAAEIGAGVCNSLIYQGLYFCLLLGLMGRRTQMREMFWLVFVACLFTGVGALLFPALGPFKVFNVMPLGNFIPEMEHLLSGKDLSFEMSKLTGVVSFPSFHTAMALAYIWGFRRTGVIGWAIAVLNVAMLITIPTFGGHYLIDMIAGAGMMLASLAIVKYAPGLWKMFGESGFLENPLPEAASGTGIAATETIAESASPGCAEASGDAC